MSHSIAIPKSMKACIVHQDKKVEVKEVPVPVIDDDEVLVKVHAVAQNPTDWKHVQHRNNPGTIIGCDFSGTLVQLGSKATQLAPSLKPGDHVAGFVQGGTYTDRGAFAEYVKASADLVWGVPGGTIGHEEAATMGCALWTAIQSLYNPNRLGLTEPPSKTPNQNEWVLIQGGSTSVGQFAVQLAHISGYKVLSTASPHNHALVKSLGADLVFDYNSPTITQDVKAALFSDPSNPPTLSSALDASSTPSSQLLTSQLLLLSPTPSSPPPKLITIQPPSPSLPQPPTLTTIQTLIYTALGREFSYGPNAHYPASIPDRTHMAQFLRKLPELVKPGGGGVKANKVMLWEGGLWEGINDGLEYMQAGKVSGVKIVYRVV